MIRPQAKGFTLIEVLLSLMVFAMLGMAIYSVLTNTIRGHETVQTQNTTLTALQRTFNMMEADIVQMAQRQIRLEGEQPIKVYLRSGEYMFDSESFGFGLVRDGWTNPGMVLPRSELQPVAYRITENTLQRLYFNFVDNELGAEPKIQTLMTGVSAIQIKYFANQEWIDNLTETSVPSLLKIGLETETYGLVERTFPVITVTKQQAQANGS